PASPELPPSLEPLARRQGIELRDTAWHDDVKRLIRRLEAIGARDRPGVADGPAQQRTRRRPRWLIACALAVLAAAAAGIAYALVGGGSSGAKATNPAAERRLLA